MFEATSSLSEFGTTSRFGSDCDSDNLSSESFVSESDRKFLRVSGIDSVLLGGGLGAVSRQSVGVAIGVPVLRVEVDNSRSGDVGVDSVSTSEGRSVRVEVHGGGFTLSGHHIGTRKGLNLPGLKRAIIFVETFRSSSS